MRVNGVISTLGWLALSLGLIITIIAFFYNFSANGALSRGVFVILMGIVIISVQNRRNKKPKNKIRASTPKRP